MFDPTFLALVGSLFLAAPSSTLPVERADSSEQTTCPVDVPLAKAAIYGLISDSQVRESENLEAVDPATLRVLTDASDAAACTYFRGTVRLRPDGAPGVRYAYYTASGYYFVAVLPADPNNGQLLTSHAGLLVYDSTRTQVGFYLL